MVLPINDTTKLTYYRYSCTNRVRITVLILRKASATAYYPNGSFISVSWSKNAAIIYCIIVMNDRPGLQVGPMLEQELGELLLTDVDSLKVSEVLRKLGFTDSAGAQRTFRRMLSTPQQRGLFSIFLPQFLTALCDAAGQDRVLSSFERFLHSSGDLLTIYRFLADNPRSVEILVRIFAGSQFLTEILLRNPEYFERFFAYRRLAAAKSALQLAIEARATVAAYPGAADQLDALRRFQRWELLRIGACDLLDLFNLPMAAAQLANLADAMVQVCLEIVVRQLNIAPDNFAVIGMGKLGGEELNYSSDIDFLFLSNQPSVMITRLGEKLIDALARVTTEGFLYRVDMRLRPWGKVGPLVSSPDGFLNYLTRHALLWEKQALLKARVVAGDLELGNDFIDRTRPLLMGGAVEAVRSDVFAMKQRTEAFLQQKGRKWGDVKLGEGSIRDVEFCVQFLQLTNGQEHPEVLSHNTLESLDLCLQAGFIHLDEYRILSGGYIFLRTIEHHLQMMDYRQTHTLPDDPQAIANLARRLGFGSGELFIARYLQHSAAIRAIYLHYVGSVQMRKTSLPRPAAKPTSSGIVDIDQHRARMSPSYAETFSEAEIARHAALVAQLDEQRLVVVDSQPDEDGTWQVTIVAYDFPGELSLICGLMYVYGLDIVKGDVFTYEPVNHESSESGRDVRAKIVDVFSVRPVRPEQVSPEIWLSYARELEELLRMMRAGQRREARGELAKRVANHLYETTHGGQSDLQAGEDPLENLSRRGAPEVAPSLYPVTIAFDNEASDRYTLMHIAGEDTTGFLYELTNSLAIYRVYIARVTVSTHGSQVYDTLFVTDENMRKITDPEKQGELRAATVLIKHFTHLLPFSPNPESAMLHFRAFIGELFKRPNWPNELASLERPEVLHALARLLGVSDFLWDDFLRMQYTNLYPVVRDVDALDTVKTRKQLQTELEQLLKKVHADPQAPTEDAPWQQVMNDFKDREMFRIDMRHIMGHTSEFWDFAAELTDLTEVVVNSTFHLCHEDLRSVYGTPLMEDGGLSVMTVCALGKCGGKELGFASDIELMFVYSGNGKTRGPHVISSAEFYEKLVTNFVRAIRARREGIFEIDLQLRPYGKAGSLAVALDAFRRYYVPDGPAWAYERQALVKLRPVAGDPGMGDSICALRDSFIYTGEPFDVTAMRAMRERQVRHLVTGGMFNLKFSPGGLVDVEYLVQGLQITHGKDQLSLRQANTREAMANLAAAGILSKDQYTRLRKAHTFLRWMIDSLRVVRGNAKDVTLPPEGSEEFAYLSRRLRYGSDPGRLREALAHYTRDVQELNAALLSV
jgi:[glutamine synthetase] adenylyltransferase / [glutamine synthetase]-adenylyl-L-tyrosine phosphorylase